MSFQSCVETPTLGLASCSQKAFGSSTAHVFLYDSGMLVPRTFSIAGRTIAAGSKNTFAPLDHAMRLLGPPDTQSHPGRYTLYMMSRSDVITTARCRTSLVIWEMFDRHGARTKAERKHKHPSELEHVFCFIGSVVVEVMA